MYVGQECVCVWPRAIYYLIKNENDWFSVFLEFWKTQKVNKNSDIFCLLFMTMNREEGVLKN